MLRANSGLEQQMRTLPFFYAVLIMLHGVAGKTHTKPIAHDGTIARVTRQCLREDLSLKEGETDAAMGGVRATNYIFTNNSSSPCTLNGYPRIELLNRKGSIARRAVGKEQLPDDNEKTPPQLVTIEPGKQAWFRLYYNAGGAGLPKPCPTYKLRVAAPGTTRAFVFRSFQWCPGTDFQVSPVRNGTPST